jgi:hypothetical protein
MVGNIEPALNQRKLSIGRLRDYGAWQIEISVFLIVIARGE